MQLSAMMAEDTNVKSEVEKNNRKHTHTKSEGKRTQKVCVFGAKRVHLSTFNGHLELVIVCVLKKLLALYLNGFPFEFKNRLCRRF